MMMIASFMDLHGIHKSLSTLSHNTQKLLVFTRYTTEKSHGLHDIKVFYNSHIIIQEGFSGLSRLEGEFQGLALWYVVKELQSLL